MSTQSAKDKLLARVAQLELASRRGLKFSSNPELQAGNGKVISAEQCEWTLKGCSMFREWVDEVLAVEPEKVETDMASTAFLTTGSDATQKLIRIYAMAFVKKSLTLSTDNREDFWLEITGGIGWVKFEKLRSEGEFTPDGALFAATELRSGLDQAPCPIVQARCVLWRQREALLSAANTISFLLDQRRSGL